MTGGVLSSTTMIELQVTKLPAESATATSRTLVPSGRLPSTVNEKIVPALVAATSLVRNAVPLRLQTTSRASPSGSETSSSLVMVVLQSILVESGQTRTGGRFVTSAINCPRISPGGFE